MSKRNVWTAENLATVKNLRQQGWTQKEIGDKFGISQQRIRAVLMRCGLWEKGQLGGRAAVTAIPNEQYRSNFRKQNGIYPEDQAIQTKRWYKKLKQKFKHKKSNAKQHGIEWNIEFGDIFFPKYCPVLGIRLDYNLGGRHDCSPSFDRINPDLGYIKGNVIIVSFRCNRIKNDATVSELRAIADFYGHIVEKLGKLEAQTEEFWRSMVKH